MEILILLFGFVFLVAPILSIIALAKASGAEKAARENKRRLEFLYHALEEHILESNLEGAVQEDEKPETVTAPAAVKEDASPASVPPPLPEKPVVAVAREATRPHPPSPGKVPRPRKNLEEALGGKVAGLVGVMILVAGIAFLVGSPGISWPSPLPKILMGLAMGGILLAGGHIADRNASGKFVQLARTMTGGGGGLFYFCIFAAYSLYHLCGPFLTAIGLTASAALLLFLSLVYNSQIVATLGILGAFITPVLVGGDIDQGIFPLVYIALINLPVMFLGIKKSWQVLYNSTYAFTLFYFFYWMLSFNHHGWLVPLAAASVYFAEFITLSLLIMQKRDRLELAGVNVARIIASTAFLFGSLYLLSYETGLVPWLGLCFACAGGVFAFLSVLSWRWLPEFKNETLCFVLCGIAAVAFCILESASNEIRGFLWCLQALCIAWFFRKPAPFKVLLGGIMLGCIGGFALGVAIIRDPVLAPAWFNVETLIVLGGVLLMGAGCWILQHCSENSEVRAGGRLLQYGSFAVILLAAYKDVFAFDSSDTLPWLVATAVFAAVARVAMRWQPRYAKETLHFTLSAILCFAVYLHMQLFGLWISFAWTLLGMGIAIFALRVQSKEIQNTAIVIGFAGLLHATLQPIQNTADLILVNPHTLCGLFSALAIGLQAKLYDRINPADQTSSVGRYLWFACIGAVLAIAYRNIFTTLPPDHPMPWLLTSAITLFVGNLVNWMLGKDLVLQYAGRLLVAAVPLKILLLDIGIPWIQGMPPSLLSVMLWMQLAMLAEILWFAGRIKDCPVELAGYFSLAPLIAGIAAISLAIGESGSAWSWAIVSLWWGVSGLSMTIFGFARKSRLHRHFALLLFAGTVLKVLLIDCSVFQAGARVMIFIGVGLLLLLLSFIYQKVSERLL
ncbi:MAG: DUF2339 domain-containing protein [Verrucomicrobiota bacterium]